MAIALLSIRYDLMAKKRAAKNRQRATCYGGAFAAPPENIVPDLSQKGRVHEISSREGIEAQKRKRAGTLAPAGGKVGETSEVIAKKIGASARTIDRLKVVIFAPEPVPKAT